VHAARITFLLVLTACRTPDPPDPTHEFYRRIEAHCLRPNVFCPGFPYCCGEKKLSCLDRPKHVASRDGGGECPEGGDPPDE
jgi:hypothetical protein